MSATILLTSHVQESHPIRASGVQRLQSLMKFLVELSRDPQSRVEPSCQKGNGYLYVYLASAASPCFLSTFNVSLACRSGGLIDQPRNFTVGTVDRVFSSVVTDKKVNSRDPFRYSDTYLRESLQPQLTSLHRSHLLATYVRTTLIAYDGAGSRYTRPTARGREQIQRRARHPHPRYESVLVAIGDGISSSAREGAVRSRQADDQDHTPPGNYQVTHHIRLAVRSVGEAGGPTRGR